MRARTFFPAAGLLCMILVAVNAADTYTLPLGDFGSIEYDRLLRTPDTPRIASLLRLVFDMHPGVGLAPTTIELMTTGDFEEFVAKREGGAAWRVWLERYRSAHERYLGWCDPVRARQGKLRIVTDEITDVVLVHESLHYINCHLTTDCLLLNNHNVIGDEVQIFMASPAYKKWKRERPWAKG
jgi:hypothetical protein